MAYNPETQVTLECPACKVYKTVERPRDVPKAVRLIAIICPDCDDGDFHEETWFSAPGVIVAPDHEPDPDLLREMRDERVRLAVEDREYEMREGARIDAALKG